jgi:putative ABC transport system permease protein
VLQFLQVATHVRYTIKIPALGAALEKAERYLGLSSIVVILISGVAIAMATRRYSERHFNSTAIPA